MLERIKSYLIVTLCIAGLTLYFLYRSESHRSEILSENQSSLLDSVQHYQVNDSLSAASIGALKLKISELKDYRSRDTKLIKQLGIRLNRVQSMSTVGISSSYSLCVTATTPQHRDSEAPTTHALQEWSHQSPWINFRATRHTDTLRTEVIVYDTITQILHRVPRFKFLGIWFGTKGVRQEIVSKNPHTRIEAAQYIEIIK